MDKSNKNSKSDSGVRINKFLSEAGLCSRREADRLIEGGQILIDGRIAVMGDKVLEHNKVIYKGKTISKEQELILLAFNKPRGVVCTTSNKQNKINIVDYINYDKRIYPVGRLDKDSEGLILMTNDGDLVNKILKGSNYHEKEYIVKVNRPITDDFIKRMSSGIPILDTVTRECYIEKLSKYEFKIILTQGLNRQIRRMCEYLGYRVVQLKRIRIMNILLADLKLGTYRKVSDKEYEELIKKL